MDRRITIGGLGPGIHIYNARHLDKQPSLSMQDYTIITGITDAGVAAEVKRWLARHLPDCHPVKVVQSAGIPDYQQIMEIPLSELESLDRFDDLTLVIIHYPTDNFVRANLRPLVEVMARLRGENGCPWDKKQSHQTLKPYLIEETYEVLEAIDKGDMHSLCEELGDLLLQIVFHAQIASEKDLFNIDDVIRTIVEKMVRRHPHVFGSTEVNSASEVLVNWEKIKQEEKAQKPDRQRSLLDSIPRQLPALLQAERVQSKVARVGFDWPDYRGALDKLREEMSELEQVLAGGSYDEQKSELGDLLFAAVNVARLNKIDAEDALRQTLDKFKRRFTYIEQKATKTNRDLALVPLEEMDRWWEEAKKLEES
ncbi:MAG: nucleoside triphosphate pyrophosphohydrolase [Peptococcaceae bacterium]|nr:nucleoside triphosphate pyrophosphohydrolase [Peptococcaceae bacterium]